MAEITYLDRDYSVNYDGIQYSFVPGTLSHRDLITQFPLQVYPKLWAEFFQPGDVVLDVGAYVGLISVQLALMGGIVHSFEGSPRNLPRLRRAVERLRQIHVHPVALSNVNEVVVTRFNDCIDREHPEQEVCYVVYDDYVQLSPKFVKMDIEGMETVALLGMKNLIEKVRPIWQIECHVDLSFRYEKYPGYVSVADGGFDFSQFSLADYSMYSLDLVPLTEMKSLEQHIFIPNEKKIRPLTCKFL